MTDRVVFTDRLPCVALLCGFDADPEAVKAYVKHWCRAVRSFVVDDEPTRGCAAAILQCRCSSVVAVQFRAAGNGRKAAEYAAARDTEMFSIADRVVVFGNPGQHRMQVLDQSGVAVERRNG